MQKPNTAHISIFDVNLTNACTAIFIKSASQCQFNSLPYLLWMAGGVYVISIYAPLLQQIIKRMRLSVAYMFKGRSLIFVPLLSALIFDEAITPQNIIGAVFIIVGIVMFAWKNDSLVRGRLCTNASQTKGAKSIYHHMAKIRKHLGCWQLSDNERQYTAKHLLLEQRCSCKRNQSNRINQLSVCTTIIVDIFQRIYDRAESRRSCRYYGGGGIFFI